MSREAAIERALTFFDDGRYIDEVAHRVAILTESQNPERLPDFYRYPAEEMHLAFEDMGYEWRIYDNPIEGKGLVLLAYRHEGDDRPTIPGYGMAM